MMSKELRASGHEQGVTLAPVVDGKPAEKVRHNGKPLLWVVDEGGMETVVNREVAGALRPGRANLSCVGSFGGAVTDRVSPDDAEPRVVDDMADRRLGALCREDIEISERKDAGRGSVDQGQLR